MPSDLTLDLPDKTRVNTLVITPTPKVYNELLQRVICLLFCADMGLTVNGQSVYHILQTAGDMPKVTSDSRLGILADAIKDKLNEEEYCISSLNITVTGEGSSVSIVFNITPADSDETITEVFYL